jgi:hypothetical protein
MAYVKTTWQDGNTYGAESFNNIERGIENNDQRLTAIESGNIATIGLDRLVALLARTDSIRDVIAFPKNAGAKCLMSDAPGEAALKQLRELHIKSTANLGK